MTLKLLTFGNPMVDLILHVKAQYIQSLGVAEGQETHLHLTTEERRNIIQTALASPKLLRVPGGSALNTARTCQVFLPRKSSLFIGAIGDDSNGDFLVEQCTEAGVDMQFIQKYSGQPTSLCLSLVSQTKERTLITQRSAHLYYRLDTKDLDACLAAADILYVVSFTLSSSPRFNCVQYLLQNKNPSRHVFCLNISSSGLLQNPDVVTRLGVILPFVQVLSGNQSEMIALGVALGFKETKACDIAQKLVTSVLQLPGALIICTNSAKPTMVFTANAPPQIFPVALPTLFKLEDTTGAGDAFLGGFFAGMYT
ncbi:adenosine kinase [Thraustotheca clavata]|uniref:Adenosine kinase n=1 Tax=Thraustotheca clavata TaxID=74557 RepID=A0A1W0A162_9STRA|nr:adenosine kinase [Thraustotheca clavata]